VRSDGSRRVIGLDGEIREHNRVVIEAHPLSHRITLSRGARPKRRSRPFVAQSTTQNASSLLDSNHSKDHVADELGLYGSLVSVGS
jgi:cephalosporin hydroxylase